MANEATLNDVIERQIAEGLLTRNSGTNSLKSLKDIIGTELSSINIGLKTLNDNFSAYLDAFKSDADDAARAAREAALERNTPIGESGGTEGGNKKFEMPDLTGGFGLGPMVLVGLAAIFTELDTVFQAIVIGVKSMMATLRSFTSLVLAPFKEGGRFFGIVTKIGGFIDKLVGRDSFFGKFLRFIGRISGLTSILGKIAGPLALVGRTFGRFIPFVQIIIGLVDFVKGFIDKFSKADNFGEGVLEGIFGGVEAVINGLIMKPLDLLKEGAIWLAKKMGADTVVKLLESFSFSDMFKTAVNWLYDTDTNVWFGGFFAGVPARVGKLFTDMTTAIGSFFTEYIYDGENNKIFGMEIPKLLFEFNFFNVIKETIDDVIKTVTSIFSGDFSLKTLLKGGLALFDLATAGINLAVNAIIDIFSWGDKKEGEPKKPFRLSDFIFGPDGIIMKAKNFFFHEDGKSGLFNLNLADKGKAFTLLNIIDELMVKAKNFFTNEEGTGIFDFSTPGEEFSIMGIVRKLMTKISEFFTSLLDIDFGSVLEKLIPEGTLGDAFRKLTGLKSPEQIKIEKQEIKAQIAIEKAEYDKRQGIINDRLDGRNFSELSNTQQTSVQNQRGLKDEAQSRIEELEARLAELEPKAAVMTQTSDSAVNTAEARLASAVNDNRLIVAPANMGGGGGGAAPDMRGGNTTVVNNSSKKTETRVSLIDRTRPEQLHARRFAAGGT